MSYQSQLITMSDSAISITTTEDSMQRLERFVAIDHLKGNSHQNIKCGLYDRATPEKFFGLSLAYVRSLEGSQKAG